MKRIEITVSRTGDVQIHVQGVSGEGCLDLTKRLEERLGGDVTSRTMTEEANAEQGIEQTTDQQLYA